MTPALRRLIAVERGELGTAERPHGSNDVKYNTAYYGHRVHNAGGSSFAWCVVFQWWCFQRAGIPTSIFPKSANVFAVRDWYQRKGRFNHTPRVGSLVIFTFSHIGLVEKVLPDGRIQTIEGNTDSCGGRTGGRVMRKIRSRQIAGYCHPDYARVRAPAAPRPASARRPSPRTRPSVSGEPVASQPKPSIHTAVLARDVAVPAARWTAVQFAAATANTGGFWKPPVGSRHGYNLVTGPGVYVADVAIAADGRTEAQAVKVRLVQADPSDHYRIVKAQPPSRIDGPGDAASHLTCLSSLGSGHHVWVQLWCAESVVVPSVAAELVLL